MTKEQLESISKEIHALNAGVWNKADIGEGLVRLLDFLCALRMSVHGRRIADRGSYEIFNEKKGLFSKPSKVKNYRLYIRSTMEEGFADLLLAVADLAAAKEMNFDALQPEFKRNFSEFTFNNNCFSFAKLVMSVVPIRKRVIMMMGFIISWANAENIDLEFYVKERISYIKQVKQNKK